MMELSIPRLSVFLLPVFQLKASHTSTSLLLPQEDSEILSPKAFLIEQIRPSVDHCQGAGCTPGSAPS